MNDIEILEKLQNIFKELRKDDEEGHSSAYELQWEDIEAIENLIQRNKELEQIEKEHKEENGRLREEVEKYKSLLAKSTADRVVTSIKDNKKSKEDLEMLNEGWKIECEKKDKIINLMGEMLVKDHEWFYSEFDNWTKQDFIEYFTNKVEEDEK